MAGGTWSETDKPERAGFYMRFVAAALAAIQPGVRGILAMPVKANWGPAKEIKEITSEKELKDTYNIEDTGNYTAYPCIRLALLGGIKTVLAYRLVDGVAAKASINLQDGAAANVLKIDSKYPTTRGFKVTTRENLVDSVNKQDLVLYENTTELFVFTFDKGVSVVDNAVAAINGNSQNVWIDATKLDNGAGTIANVVSQPLAGGNDGTAGVVNADYIDAMSVFEARIFNAFTLDGATDAALQTSVAAWVARLRNEGKKIIAYLGGSATDDADITVANARSNGFNYEGIVNVGVSAQLDGVLYPSSMVACYIASKGTGQALRESLTYAVTPFDDVQPRLTDNQFVSALRAGTLVLMHDGEKVIIERGINTLTTLSEDQDDAWKKIKIIRIIDAIDVDTTQAAHDNYIGKVLNNNDGQAALLSAIKKYFETLAPTLINGDFTVEVDTELQANALGDEFYWKWNARVIDSMEKIFGTGIIRY